MRILQLNTSLNCESEGSHYLYVNGRSIEPTEKVTLVLLGVTLDKRLVLITLMMNSRRTRAFSEATMPSHQSRFGDVRFRSFYLEQFLVLPSNMAPLLIIEHSKHTLRYVTNNYKSD